ALAIQEKALGANHTDVARTLYNLALMYLLQGKYAAAAAREYLPLSNEIRCFRIVSGALRSTRSSDCLLSSSYQRLGNLRPEARAKLQDGRTSGCAHDDAAKFELSLRSSAASSGRILLDASRLPNADRTESASG
ncbi:MAG TPA: tetratricopeptide repeat protein, partial [Bradyrhizobium sp.]